MQGRTHLLAGAAVGFVTTISLAQTSYQADNMGGFIIGAAVLGSLLPDIDSPNSKISKSCFTAKATSLLTNELFGHRGLFHTPFFVLLLMIGQLLWYNAAEQFAWQLAAMYIGAGFIAGYISHLILDFNTPMGLMLFYPFNKKYISSGISYNATQKLEKLIFSVAGLYTVAELIFR